jgi:hypothetical protein
MYRRGFSETQAEGSTFALFCCSMLAPVTCLI